MVIFITSHSAFTTVHSVRDREPYLVRALQRHYCGLFQARGKVQPNSNSSQKRPQTDGVLGSEEGRPSFEKGNQRRKHKHKSRICNRGEGIVVVCVSTHRTINKRATETRQE